MDYEKKYKELLEKAKDFNFQGYIDEECLYDMFPELRESEEERMKRIILALIAHCMDSEEVLSQYGSSYDEVKAWLEKQKHTKKDVDIESMIKAYKQRIVKQDGMENNPLIDMCLACFKHGVENTLGELNCEQILANSAKTCKNEQKPDKCDGCNNVKGCVTCVNGNQWAHYSEVKE